MKFTRKAALVLGFIIGFQSVVGASDPEACLGELFNISGYKPLLENIAKHIQVIQFDENEKKK